MVTINKIQLTTNATNDINPQINGNSVVWHGFGGTDGGTDDEIFYYMMLLVLA